MDEVEDNPWESEGEQTLESSPVQQDDLFNETSLKNPQLLNQKVERDIKQPSVREKGLVFGICVVDFHHIRGPEIEYWCDEHTTELNHDEQIQKWQKIWPNLPFQLLPDGAHQFEETFSTFTLLYDEQTRAAPLDHQTDFSSVTTLFGCACIRQLSSDELVDRADDITRSTVQKSVVLISRYPITIQLREKLSIITKSFFLQKNFNNKVVIKQLYDNISIIYNNEHTKISNDLMEQDTKLEDDVEVLYESDFYMGLTLKEMLIKYRRELLVIFKLLLLEQRIVVFSKNLLKLSNFQFSLISLIPNLILNLQDCGSPDLCNLSKDLKEPDSFNIMDRGSILRFVGLPLQIFNKGGFFEPYLSLQQLDSLGKLEWYLIGTSNDLLLDQKLKIADMIIYIDSHNDSIEFLKPELSKILQLTSQDRRFIDNLISKLNGEDDEEIMTSAIYNDLIMEDLIRNSFENYLIGMLSSVKYDNFLSQASESQLRSINRENPILHYFNSRFIDAWRVTKNYKIFQQNSYNEFFTMDQFRPHHVGDELSSLNKFWLQQRNKFRTMLRGPE